MHAAACIACEAGYTCDAATAELLGELRCPVGFFCPHGTAYGGEQPCPAGSFSEATGLEAADECEPCPAGAYCAYPGASTPTGACAEGYFCPEGSTSSQAFACEVGAFCPPGSAAPTPCQPSQFCGNAGLGEPGGACEPGYYCKKGAPSATPPTVLSADADHGLCPEGSYCPAGTSEPQPCPAGTFSDALGAYSLDDCKECLAGKYCGTAGLTEPTGDCAGGYYCSGGAATPKPDDGLTGDACPIGRFCAAGTAIPLVRVGGAARARLARAARPLFHTTRAQKRHARARKTLKRTQRTQRKASDASLVECRGLCGGSMLLLFPFPSLGGKESRVQGFRLAPRALHFRARAMRMWHVAEDKTLCAHAR